MDHGQPLFTDGDDIGFELVRDDPLRRKALLLQQLSQQSLGRSSAAPWLDQEVKHLALVIDRPPQPMFPATDLDNHLVEVPARTGARTAAAKIDGDQSAEFQEPASYGLVRYINATFGQQVLDITKRQGEPSVKPDRVLDNLRRKPMSLEGYLDHPETVAAPDRFGHRLNVSMPQNQATGRLRRENYYNGGAIWI